MKALRGIPLDNKFVFMVQQEEEVLASQTARNQLGMTEVSDMAGTDPVMRRKSSILYRSNFAERLHNE